MTDPEIQAIVIEIVQLRLRINRIKDKQLQEFLIIVHDLEIEELHELEALNPK